MTNYDLSGAENATQLLTLFSTVNDAAGGGLFGGMALVAIFVGLLSISLSRQNPPAESFFFASVAVLPLSVVFLYLDIVPIVWVIASSVLLAISAIALTQK